MNALILVDDIIKLRDNRDLRGTYVNCTIIDPIYEVYTGNGVKRVGNVKLRVQGHTNRDSSYGCYYIKYENLQKYLNKNEGDKEMTNKFKYTIRVQYLERGLTKWLGTNDESIKKGDFLVVNSDSKEYALVKVEAVNLMENKPEYASGIFDRRIVMKVEDTYGIKLKQLKATTKRIKEINKYVSEKYMLVLLRQETNQELEDLKNELESLILLEGKLKEELELND